MGYFEFPAMAAGVTDRLWDVNDLSGALGILRAAEGGKGSVMYKEIPLYAQCPLLLFSISLLLLFEPFAQHKQHSTQRTVDWKALTPQVQAALGSEFCDEKSRSIDIIKIADVTGDGIPDALVDYCHMGAYTDHLMQMRLERGNLVVAKFRDERGMKKIDHIEFLDGASVRNGASTKLLPERHAIYMISWHADDSGELEMQTCGAQAYVWNQKSQTFDANRMLSNEVTQRECRRIQRELRCLAQPCPNSK
ncbi:MAG: hypothetical protein DMG76_31855 [Acidobacteria bacterium]|nr:MAG: hypothetical protein DMG76_31855 [Acidobacteriota bacterium]